MSSRQRLDLLLLEKKLVSTRTKAQELIRAGAVWVEGRACRQPGEKILTTADVRLTQEEHPFVSRGGLKLAAALSGFGLSVAGRRVLDIGQSTGGFTHCLIREGAEAVVGVEVGHGQLAEELRNDPKVRCLEHQDFRALKPEQIAPPFSFVVADLSFISLAHLLPVLPTFLATEAEVILLVKPQFEVGPENVGSGGVVRDPAQRARALRQVEAYGREAGFTVAGAMDSPVEGGDGNQEFLLHLRWISSAKDF